MPFGKWNPSRVLVACGAMWVAACHDAVSTDGGVDQVRIAGDAVWAIEPAEQRALTATCLDRAGRVLAPATCRVSWSVGAADIATVANGVLIGQREGATTITARVGDRTAQAAVQVAWREGARISIGGARDLEVGDAIRLQTHVREWIAPVAGVTPRWFTSNPSVASIDTGGLLTAVAPGTVTVSAQLAGLSASVIVTITRVAPVGFGCAYLPDAYDVARFVGRVTPPPSRAFTKGGTVGIAFLGDVSGLGGSFPAYDFGWLRGGALAPVSAHPIAGLTLHAMSLDTLSRWPCMGRREDRTFACFTRDDEFGAIEAVALTGAAFTGTALSVVVAEPNAVTGDDRVQVRPGSTRWQRHVAVNGFLRRDLYWFVTPTSWSMVPRDGGFAPSTCVLAPASATPADHALTVLCTATSEPSATVLNATGFAADAHRDGYAALFAEVGANGDVLRFASGQGLTVSAARRGASTTLITIRGDAVSATARWPAVLVTPVAMSETARCALDIPGSAPPSTTFEVIVHCSEPNVGFMFGAVY